ncbi:hypothetical protein SLEP1_g35692 [Rubroshorea leprosula]|uniref:Uncharacterized protein n=1 Tax=Rubroshorea leprosula TaxID=152421 RepID=A0AAV5KP31_9ROSI|nr:hypothetical protein SLEP1_g35692 [Rubroshorea leprosula]
MRVLWVETGEGKSKMEIVLVSNYWEFSDSGKARRSQNAFKLTRLLQENSNKSPYAFCVKREKREHGRRVDWVVRQY